MGHAEGDRKRAAILHILKGHPNGRPIAVIARSAGIYEPKLTQYHLKVLMNAGLVVRYRGPMPTRAGNPGGSGFFYRLATDQEVE